MSGQQQAAGPGGGNRPGSPDVRPDRPAQTEQPGRSMTSGLSQRPGTQGTAGPGAVVESTSGDQPGQSGPRANRPPLEPPQMGQLNRGLEGIQASRPALQAPASGQPGPEAAQHGHAPQPARPLLEAPQLGQSTPAPVLPHDPGAVVGHQTATAALGRPPRPPLEPPQLGQLNRPLHPDPAPGRSGSPAGAPGPGAPSGLQHAPGAPSGPQPAPGAPVQQPGGAPARDLPARASGEASGAPVRDWSAREPGGAPSGLPGRPADAPRLIPPATSQDPDDTDEAPSGLPHRTQQ